LPTRGILIVLWAWIGVAQRLGCERSACR